MITVVLGMGLSATALDQQKAPAQSINSSVVRQMYCPYVQTTESVFLLEFRGPNQRSLQQGESSTKCGERM